MAISTESNESPVYTGNGVATLFATGFYFLAESELVVTLTPIATGVPVVQTLGVHYTVGALPAVDTAGYITMLTAPLTGDELTIVRTVPFVQNTSFRGAGTFSPSSHEDQFDEVVMMAQQLNTRVKAVESAGAPGSVVAGNGLTFTGSTLNVIAGEGIVSNADDVAVAWGITAQVADVDASTSDAGAAAEVARADHKHNITTGTPVAVSDSANAAGTASSLARSDHRHNHGALGGGTDHAVATISTAGFMSAADKTILDGIGAENRRNFVHNGGFDFWQRGTSNRTVSQAGIGASRSKYMDRWYGFVDKTSGASTLDGIFSRPAGAAPEVHYSCRIRKSTATAVGVIGIGQEFNRDTSATMMMGKVFTVRLRWRRGADFSGVPLVRLVSSDDPDETWYGGYIGALTTLSTSPASPGTSFETFTFTFPALPTHATGHSLCLQIGATYANATGGGANDYLDVQEVSLVEGTSAPTAFERAGITIDGEFRICEAYYEKSYVLEDEPGTATVANVEKIYARLDGSTIANGDAWPFTPIKFRTRKVPRGFSGTAAVDLWSTTGVAGDWALQGAERGTLAFDITDCSFALKNNDGAPLILDTTIKSLVGHWAADFDY